MYDVYTRSPSNPFQVVKQTIDCLNDLKAYLKSIKGTGLQVQVYEEGTTTRYSKVYLDKLAR